MEYNREIPELTHREQMVLQHTIQNFIATASPIASKTLAARHGLNVSPSTIRSDMNSLETKGYLDHPHTSSGRIPTELGYRFYVNSLMQAVHLTPAETRILDSVSSALDFGEMDEAVFTGAKLLARLSNLLAVNIAPKLADGTFRKIEMVSIGSNWVLVLLTIESGLLRKINIEVETELGRNELDRVSSILNERFSGRVLREIKAHIREMLADYAGSDETGLIRFFIDRADTIFEEQQLRRFHFGGVEYMALQPEFSDLKSYKSIIEIVEQEDLIVHLFEVGGTSENVAGNVQVRIGSENKLEQMEQCSIVSANYQIGNVTGTIGLVGPTRMDYARMVSLVEQLAKRFNKPASD